MLEDIVRRVYLIPNPADHRNRLMSAREMLIAASNILGRGLNVGECRELLVDVLRTSVRILGVDPESLDTETAVAINMRLIDACLDTLVSLARRYGMTIEAPR